MDSGHVPPELSDQQIKQLPPSTIDSYIIARESAGDIGIFSRVNALLTAGAESDAISEELRRDLSSQNIEYRDGLPPSDGNYAAIDHQKLKTDIEPIKAEGITVYSDGYHKLHQLFQELSDRLKQDVTKSQQEWEGGAADSAHGYFSGLSTWADGNSHNARMASDIVNGEAEAATRAKNSMPEPIPFSMDQEMKNWGSNPFSIHEEITKTIEKQAQSRQAHDEAVQVMAQYDADLQDAGNKQPVFAEPPKFSSSGGAGGPDMPSANVISIPGGDAGTSASGFAGGVGGSPTGPAGGGAISTSPGGGAGSSSPPLAGGPSTGAGAAPPVGTAPSGFQPGQRPPATRPGNRPGSGPNQFGPGGGPMPVGGMPPGGGQFGPGGGPGTAGRMSGGFGPGGGAGAGAGGAAGPGAGAGTGAKAMGGPAAAAGPGAAAPGAGSGARGGMGGAPMGGAGGKGGQGGEDSDHQRPTFLVEADPDEVFGTSERTAPPVIGA
ncbi:hypothetical protein B1813_15040 [Saccharomonospora piscinae]|uniref:PPE family protein n=1 Tax=Saccharomonospora piscinae TaxID=687388 RepID=A0A1V9A2R6_SACPI|nr:hypothetical protein B1813_15040 [Saccharomonospora piscinae]